MDDEQECHDGFTCDGVNSNMNMDGERAQENGQPIIPIIYRQHITWSRAPPQLCHLRQWLRFPEQTTNQTLYNDWSFGTIIILGLIPQGSSYTGVREEFLRHSSHRLT